MILYFFIINFLVKNKKNAKKILEAGDGFVVPGIVAADYEDTAAGAKKVKELKEVTDIISIGLGGGGNPQYAERVVEIASLSDPGHINQPFEKAAYSRGFLEGK